MKIRMILLKAFGYGWVSACMLMICFGIAHQWLRGGFPALQDMMNPFDVWNVAAFAITLAPGLGTLMWADKVNTGHPARG